MVLYGINSLCWWLFSQHHLLTIVHCRPVCDAFYSTKWRMFLARCISNFMKKSKAFPIKRWPFDLKESLLMSWPVEWMYFRPGRNSTFAIILNIFCNPFAFSLNSILVYASRGKIDPVAFYCCSIIRSGLAHTVASRFCFCRILRQDTSEHCDIS